MKIFLRLLSLLVIWNVIFCVDAAVAAGSPGMELIADGEQLDPSSTVEIRFDQPMVSRDEIGVVATQPPIVFDPVLPGKFTWLSSRSGVFVPDTAPPLDAYYKITGRPDLKTAGGKPIGRDFKAKLRTPPFAILRSKSGYSRGGSIPPDVTIRYAFNLGVDLKSAEKLFQFVADNGEKVSAKVRFATGEDYFSLDANEGDWEERWKLAQNPVAQKSGEQSDEERQKPLPNRLIVTPSTPLTSGPQWTIEMAANLASANGKYRLLEPWKIPLGIVEPFTLQSVDASSQINSGRSLTLLFSSDVAPDINEENGAEFFHFAPAVKNLRVQRDYSSVSISGDFQRGQDYQLTIDPKIVSSDGLPLAGAATRSVRFEAVSPRLYLPEITGSQIRGGMRKFVVRSVNLQKLRVTARLVGSSELPQAIEAFAKYNKDYDEKAPDESYQPLPPDAIQGKILQELTLDLLAGVDMPQTTTVDWDQIVGPKMAGTIFLTVEGDPIAEVGGKRPGAQSLIQLTNLGVLWKKAGRDLRVSVFSLATGKPLSGAHVTLLDAEFKSQAQGTSDDKGDLSLAIPTGVSWLVVNQLDDAVALRMGPQSEDLPTAGFNLPIYYRDWDAEPDAEQMRGMIFTDRPLYQPGETVKVKGLVRSSGAGGLTPAIARGGDLSLTNPKGDQLEKIEITTGQRGEFDAEFVLGSNAVGRHSLRFEIPGAGTFYAYFEVADYQPNAFELKAALPDRFSPDEKIAANITANYLFGAPLSKAQVRWTLRQSVSTDVPDGYNNFRLPITEDGSEKILAVHGETSLGETGGCVISPQVPDAKGAPSKNILTVEATDINQQTVTDSRTFIRDSSDFYLGIAQPPVSVYRVGEKVPVQVIAIAPDGQPLQKPIKVAAELIQQRHETVRVQGAGNAISFKSEEIEESVASATGQTLIPTREGDQWKTRDGQTALLTPNKPGDYLLRVKAADSHGREVLTEWPFSVAGPGETVWDYRNPAQIDLVPDKAQYQIGDTAHILVKAPISGEALVSIQQYDRILRTHRVQLTGNAPLIEVHITTADAPNIFVELLLIRGTEESTRQFKMPEYRHGICRLTVEDPRKKLLVEVTPSVAETAPEQELTTTITVRDGLGKPMPDAEVTFFAVDDGILALTGYDRPNPGKVFGEPWGLSVQTGLSIFGLMPENPEDLEFGNKGYLIGGGGMEGPGLRLRRNFPGTLAWMPSLRTDASGKISVKLTAPDALTRYRLVAVAHALGDYFGSGESAFVIRKALSLLPSLGQFANVGDEIFARAVVRNDTGADGSAEVTLVLDSTAESSKPLTVSIPVRNGKSEAVDFPVRLRAMGTASWQWTAKMAVEGKIQEDGVISTMSVGSPSLLLRETYLTDLAGKTNDLLTNVNPQLLEGAGSVAVTVSNTRLATLRESVSQLLEYPYGCAEQTTSALIPWLTLQDLRPVLPELSGRDEKKTIQASVDKLFAMQTPSGGLSYWPGGTRISLFASAYAGVAFAMLEKQGVELPAGWEKLLSWLSSELRSMDKVRDEQNLADRTLALYALALAGRAEPAYHEKLYLRRADLSLETRALLALAVAESGGASDVIADLLDSHKPAPESFSWFGGSARERAIQLLAWSRFKPKSGEVPRLVKELLASRRNGEWGTTQQNAWALLALSKYFTTVEKGGKNVAGTLLAKEQSIPFQVTNKEPSETHIFDFDPQKPASPLAVENPKKLPLFGETRFVVRPPVGKQPRQNRGYAVSRSYQKLATDGKLETADQLQVGDRILVTLRLETSRPGHFVAIDDPLPAIFEAVNPAFKAQAVAGGDALEEDWSSDYREIRKDRVLIFCDHLPAGAFTFHYLARVRSAGTVTAPATKVEEMYRPERFGLGETLQVASRATQ